ncbi:MAG: phosphoribosylamine--glycine ligase [Actinomycetota bacterium]
MRVLVVGSGGREHAIAWRLRESASVDKVFAAPGNPGIDEVATCVSIGAAQHDRIAAFVREEQIDLVVVGPEQPLVDGLADLLREHGIRVFGPSARAARIEGSKSYAKDVMRRAGIPTAASASFSAVEPALAFLRELGAPCVVKADGLAAGKGVRVCENLADAADAVRDCLEARVFGESGSTVLIEEMMEGEEVSVFCLTDGASVVPFGVAQDHKRLLDGDTGPNTGGMGAYSPVPHLDVVSRTVTETFEPLVARMADDGTPFQGVLFGGFMVTSDGPKVIEFNARFGDPETQALLPRLQSDFGELLFACANGSLDSLKPEWSDDASACVVLAGRGYPQRSDQGTLIEGLTEAAATPGVKVFHAGTARNEEGAIVTNGGRVVSVTALGASVAEARSRAYEAVSKITFEGMQVRSDIAAKGMGGTR